MKIMKLKRVLFLFTFMGMIISCDKKEENVSPNLSIYPIFYGQFIEILALKELSIK
jgi:hypothetical protein